MCSFKKHEHVNRQQANNMTMAQEKLQTWKVLARALCLEKNPVMGGHSACLDNVHDGCYLSLGFMPSTFLPWNTHTHEHVYMHTHSQDQYSLSMIGKSHSLLNTQRWMNNCWQWNMDSKGKYNFILKQNQTFNSFLNKGYLSNVQVNKITIHL